MLGVIVVIIVSYVAGAVPFSYWAGRTFAGIDLREHGSGNLAGANVTMTADGEPVALMEIKGQPWHFFALRTGLVGLPEILDEDAMPLELVDFAPSDLFIKYCKPGWGFFFLTQKGAVAVADSTP